MVWSVPEARHSLSDIRALQLDTPAGGHVRLDQVANVQIAPEPNAIVHENLSRRLDVTANVRGRDLGAVAGDVERAVHSVAMPLGYHAEILGEWTERQAAQQQLLGFAGWRPSPYSAPLHLVRHPRTSGADLPDTAVRPGRRDSGDVRQRSRLSLGSLVGFFTILGIAARNGIMLISHYQHLERGGG